MGKRGRPPHPGVLTPRAREVLAHIREGLSNEDIAGRLGISLDGVKYHVSQILGKLGVSSRQEAAEWNEELPPWWQRALATVAFISRRAASSTSRLGLLSAILSGGLLLAAIGGLAALGVLALRAHDRSGTSEARTGLGVLAPQPISSPAVRPSATPQGVWNTFWQLDDGTGWLAGEVCQAQSDGTTTCGQGIIDKTTDSGSTWQE